MLLWVWPLPFLAWARADAAVPVFDLPAQPLEQALERFSVLSGWSVIYHGTLAQGRTSHAVQGAMPSAQALALLWQGTGLVPEHASDSRAVLREADPTGATEPAASADALDAAAVRREFGTMQRRLRDLFCGDPVLAPGTYSAQVGQPRLWAVAISMTASTWGAPPNSAWQI